MKKDDNYSKRELDVFFNDIREKFLEAVTNTHNEVKEIKNELLPRMEAKLDYTNGKVRGIQIWKAGIVGAMGVISAIVIPMTLYIWYVQSERIDRIEKVFSQYNIEVK